jgi:nucleosome binding factor SPN SPT16 subunit
LHNANIATVAKLSPAQKTAKYTAANACHDHIVDLFARALVLLYRSADIPNSMISRDGAIPILGGGSFQRVRAMQKAEEIQINQQEKQGQEQEGGQQEQEQQEQEQEQKQEQEQEQEQDGGKQGKTKRSPKSKPLRRSKKANRV